MISIERHKTALSRSELSRPVRSVIADGLLSSENTFFDYGCGKGGDIRHLGSRGISARGWDPAFRPETDLVSSDVVNIGYVLNVIEDPSERVDVLTKAWSITESVLVVSARLYQEVRNKNMGSEYKDGYITSIGTFQKFYKQDELKEWIEGVLKRPAQPAEPGIFYVFRDTKHQETFIANRYRRRFIIPRILNLKEQFKKHEIILSPLMSFFTERGRVPYPEECENINDVKDEIGSIRQAYKIIFSSTNKDEWKLIEESKKNDLIVYLALSRFGGRPKLSDLPDDIRFDVKGFFGNYKNGCGQADNMLFTVGSTDHIRKLCSGAVVGKKMPSALYVHKASLELLPCELRIYEGCANRYIGEVDGANIIKLNHLEPKVSYLTYPNFDKDPHPALARSLTVNLQTFKVKVRDYTSYKNPPILHRKEEFVHANYPGYEKFSRLTRIEEMHGLYENPNFIGTSDGWLTALSSRGLTLKGHRLIKDHD